MRLLDIDFVQSVRLSVVYCSRNMLKIYYLFLIEPGKSIWVSSFVRLRWRLPWTHRRHHRQNLLHLRRLVLWFRALTLNGSSTGSFYSTRSAGASTWAVHSQQLSAHDQQVWHSLEHCEAATLDSLFRLREQAGSNTPSSSAACQVLQTAHQS